MSNPLGSVGTAYIDLEVAKGKLKASFQEAEKDIGKSMQQLGGSMTSAGETMSMALTLPILGLGAAVAKVAGDFEVEMNRVKALTGSTGDQFEILKGQARDLGATTQFSASQAAEGMGFLAQAGFDANEIMGAMPATLSLAAAAQIELGEAADVASNVLSGYGMTADQLGSAIDVLVATTAKSNTNFQQLGEAMKYAGPVAKSAGIEFDQAAAAIGLMGNAGIQGSMAGTSLRGAISKLLAPTKEAEKSMKKLGLEVTDSHGRLVPFRDIVEQLGPVADETADIMTIFGLRAGPAMAAMAGQGVEEFDKLTKAIEENAGITKELEDAYTQSLPGKLKALRSAFEELLLTIADAGFLDMLKDIIGSVREFTVRLSELDPRIIKAGIVIAGLAAAIGPVLIVLGTLISSIGTIVTLFGSLGVAAAAVGPVVVGLGAALAGVAAGGALGWLLMKVPIIKKAILALGDAIYNLALKVPGLSTAVNFLADAWDAVSGNSKQAADDNKTLERTIKTLNSELEKHGFEVDRGSMSLEEWGRAVNEAGKELALTKDSTEDLTKEFEDNTAAADDMADQTESLGDVTKEAAAVFNEFGAQVNGSIEELDSMSIEVRAAADRDIPDLTTAIERSISAFELQREEMERVEAEFQRMRGQVDLLSDDSLPKVITGVGKLPAAFENSFSDAKTATKSFGDEFERQVSTVVTNFAQAVGDMIWEWEDFGDALKDIGKKFISAVVSLFVEQLFAPLLSGLSSLFSGGGFNLGSLFGGGAGAAAGSGAGGAGAGAGAAGAGAGLYGSMVGGGTGAAAGGGAGGGAAAGGLGAGGIAAIAGSAAMAGFMAWLNNKQLYPEGIMPAGAYYNVTIEGTDITIDPESSLFSGMDLSAITSNMPGQSLSLDEVLGMGFSLEDLLNFGIISQVELEELTRSNASVVDSVDSGNATIHEDLNEIKESMNKPLEMNMTWNISALDGADVEQVVRNRIIPEINEAITNREFTATKSR